MPFPDDRYGFELDGGSRMSRRNIKFTGELSNGMPFIGCITFDDIYDEKFTLEGKFNNHLQIIGVGKQTSTRYGMIIIGNHDENGMLQG